MTRPELFVPALIALEDWASFGDRDYPGMVDDAKQAMLRLKLRRDHGCGLRGQIITFDRTGGQ
jgi:hypothetical protein